MCYYARLYRRFLWWRCVIDHVALTCERNGNLTLKIRCTCSSTENLAANWGYGTYEYTRTRTPTEVLQAWFEDEMNRPFGANGHFTQVGWRSTKYVGCGVASKTFGAGSVCNIQVCRYITPGNCNVNPGNWNENMLADESFCDPECPKGGCF